MKKLRPSSIFSAHVLFVCSSIACASLFGIPQANAQDGRWREERLCRTVQQDVRSSTGYARLTGRERDRVDNVLRHISEFDNRFRRGQFDKDKLDQAIDDLKNVVEHNPLDERARQFLSEDLSHLREFRARRG